MGLSYEDAQILPLTELLDLICIEQIKHEGYRYKVPEGAKSDDDALDELLAIQ